MLSDQIKLSQLRMEMKTKGIDAYLVNQTDEYQNEFLPSYSRRLTWLTNFSGSAGEAIITRNKAYLFVDGRYTLQAKIEVNEKLYSIYNYNKKSPQDILNTLKLKKVNYAIDGNIVTARKLKFIKSEVKKNISIKLLTKNLIDIIWKSRPKVPKSNVWHHEDKFHGTKVSSKIVTIKKIIKQDKADYLFITSNESICWLLNLRGGDLTYTPIFMSRLIIDKYGNCYLFADIKNPLKFPKEINLTIIKPKFFNKFLSTTLAKKKIIADDRTLPANINKLFHEIKSKVKLRNNPIELLKSQKNITELKGVRSAHLRDGVALTKSIFWIKDRMSKGTLTELQAVKKIDSNRKAEKYFHSLSFPTIAGSGPNGAIVHYHATKKTDRKIQKSDLFLIDSGGQYQDGTTDVTRTISFEKVTNEQKKMNTLVLKGHIAVALSKFSKSETGKTLNRNARKFLRKNKCDFDHGTGHGVGYFLNVHEGPQSISSASQVKFLPGMIISNEPGYYKADAYGIRIENLVAVKKNQNNYELETLTLAPLDKQLIEPNLLTKKEINWINSYHKKVYRKLRIFLNPIETKWLKQECADL